MSDMVERVAAALAGAVGERDPLDPKFLSESAYGDMARAAIAAMREPTPGMTEAAAQTLFRENQGIEYAPAIGWRAMIDAALASSE